MIKKEEYLKAKKTIDDYEQQLNLSNINSSICYILVETKTERPIVVLDKEYADALYSSGGFVMMEGKLIDVE